MPLHSPSSNCPHHRPAQDRPRQHGQLLLWRCHNTINVHDVDDNNGDNDHVHVVDGDDDFLGPALYHPRPRQRGLDFL